MNRIVNQVAVLASLSIVLAAATASGFCRTTTCGAGNTTECRKDADGCAATGQPLFWHTSCIRFAVEGNGSDVDAISFERARTVIERAFATWETAECSAGTMPSFSTVAEDEPARASGPEFTDNPGNRNTWLFHDESWPYVNQAHAIALSSVTFRIDSGRILDVDVEINSAQFDITMSDETVKADLQSIATHEAGHFLGLSHSRDSEATMFAFYRPGDMAFRTLADDDAAGICAVYPPGEERPCLEDPVASARSSTTGGCGCSLGERAPGRAGVLAVVAALLGLGHRRRRARG